MSDENTAKTHSDPTPTAAAAPSKDAKPGQPTRTPPTRTVRRVAVRKHTGWRVASPIKVKIGDRTMEYGVGEVLEFGHLCEQDEAVFSNTGVIEPHFTESEE